VRVEHDAEAGWVLGDADRRARVRRGGCRREIGGEVGTGGKQILVDDPSGNPVELFEPTIPEARL